MMDVDLFNIHHSTFIIRLRSVEQIFLLRVDGDAGEELVDELVSNLKGVVEELVAESLQHVMGFHRTLLIDGEIVLLKLFLPLIVLGFELGIGFLDQWRIGVVVDHAQCHHLAETPVSRG